MKFKVGDKVHFYGIGFSIEHTTPGVVTAVQEGSFLDREQDWISWHNKYAKFVTPADCLIRPEDIKTNGFERILR